MKGGVAEAAGRRAPLVRGEERREVVGSPERRPGGRLVRFLAGLVVSGQLSEPGVVYLPVRIVCRISAGLGAACPTPASVPTDRGSSSRASASSSPSSCRSGPLRKVLRRVTRGAGL